MWNRRHSDDRVGFYWRHCRRRNIQKNSRFKVQGNLAPRFSYPTIILDQELIAKHSLERAEVEAVAQGFLQAFPGIAAVYTRTQLLDQVWGDHVFLEERTIDVHIRRLRKSLEPTGHDKLVQTVRATGYRFSAQA